MSRWIVEPRFTPRDDYEYNYNYTPPPEVLYADNGYRYVSTGYPDSSLGYRFTRVFPTTPPTRVVYGPSSLDRFPVYTDDNTRAEWQVRVRSQAPPFPRYRFVPQASRIVSVVGTGSLVYLAANAIKRAMPAAAVYLFYQGAGDTSSVTAMTQAVEQQLLTLSVRIGGAQCWLLSAGMFKAECQSTAVTGGNSKQLVVRRGGDTDGAVRLVKEVDLTNAAREAAIQSGVNIWTSYKVGPTELDRLVRYDDLVLTAPPTMEKPRDWLKSSAWKVPITGEPWLTIRGTLNLKSRLSERPRWDATHGVLWTPVPNATNHEVDAVVIVKPYTSTPQFTTNTFTNPDPTNEYYKLFLEKTQLKTTDIKSVHLSVAWNIGQISPTIAFRFQNANVILLGNTIADRLPEYADNTSRALNDIQRTADFMSGRNAIASLNAQLSNTSSIASSS